MRMFRIGPGSPMIAAPFHVLGGGLPPLGDPEAEQPQEPDLRLQVPEGVAIPPVVAEIALASGRFPALEAAVLGAPEHPPDDERVGGVLALEAGPLHQPRQPLG